MLFALLWVTGSAQNFKAADRYFEGKAYSLALTAYEQEQAKANTTQAKAYAQYKVAECLLGMNHPEQSISFFETALQSGYNQASIYFSYGKALQILGHYNEAKQQFQRYQQQNPADKRTANLLVSCDFALSDTESNPLYAPLPLSVTNTSGSEYGIAYYQGGLIYSSTGAVGFSKDVSPRTGLPHSQIYFSQKQDTGYMSGSLINSIAKENVNVGTFCFDPVTHKLYYSSCEEGEKNCYVSEVEVKNGKYRVLGKLKIGNSLYSIGHPFITDNRIYFTSAMKGGYGGTDIWFIDRKKDNRWGSPVNTGSEVNTPGNESFPFIDGDKLFFASDGQVGYGGLDIFVSDIRNDGKIGKAQNIGRPFNTSYDDFNLIIDSNRQNGMLVSNRNNMLQSDDIYTFINFPSQIKISGIISSPYSIQAGNISIQIESNRGELQTISVDGNGVYEAYLLPDRDYTIGVPSVGSMGYTMQRVSTQGICVEDMLNINLAALPDSQPIHVAGFAYDNMRKTGIPNANIMIQLDGAPFTTVQTDFSGRYTADLPPTTGTYTFIQDVPGYLPDVKQLTLTMPNSSKPNSYSVDFSLVELKKGAEFTISDILYDFDKAMLSKIAKQSLNYLVRLLHEYPAMKISISSHTDARGNSEYNFKLSMARAHSVEQYLLDNGIDPSRFISKAYGKSRLLYPNAKTSEEHHQNRRTTFSIITMGEGAVDNKKE